MTKSDLIKQISDKLPYLAHKDSEIIVTTIFDSMGEALGGGEGIEIRSFGSFKIKYREERCRRHWLLPH